MKKIISILLAVVLISTLIVIPTSAVTNKTEWQKQNGPGKIEFNEQGAKCVLDEGLTFFKYTKQMIDIKNFTCTFFQEQKRLSGSFYAMTLNSSKAYAGTGSYGLFILLRFREEGVVNVEGQILHVGYYLTENPRSVDIKVDTSKPLVLKGKDNGNGTYTLSFEGGTGEYTFEIPENYQFTEDLNGEGYFSFGGSSGEEENRTITVTSINDIDFSGSKPEPSSSKPTSSDAGTTDADTKTDTNDGLIIGADDNTTTNTSDGSEDDTSNSALIIVIIICGALILAAVVAVVVIVIKKKKSIEEKTSEEIEE